MYDEERKPGAFDPAGESFASVPLTSPGEIPFEYRERMLQKQSRNATLSLWISLGSIVFLLLSCFLGSFLTPGNSFAGIIALMIVLLIVSVLLFFLPGRSDQRWYVVCALLNEAGIGFATVMLLKVLDLDIRVVNLLLSGIPVGVFLFAIVVFYNSTASESRHWFLIVGIVILAITVIFSVIRYIAAETEFWVCLAVNALMSCAGLGALIWANGDWENRSVLKGLAIGSFSVYLLILLLAIAALILSSDSDSDSDSGSGGGKSWRGSRSGSRSRSRSVSTGSIPRTTGNESRNRNSFSGSRFYYDPYYMWYYTPTVRSSPAERMQGMSEDEQKAYYRKYRIRKALILAGVTVLALGIIVAVVLLAGV